ncbi:SIS domain-containing protein [Streptomyces sp. NPDC004111]|uniref:SIS domain-containing protein n=1 Tax=Streptomyces sp. NPDC004111 TaxID=3364690 RepID=UPI0036A3AD27
MSDLVQLPPAAGSAMAAEVAEQPHRWQRMLDRYRAPDSELARAAALVRAYRPRFVLLVARGTSDHAALYAKYLFEVLCGLPCGLVSPSTTTAYGAEPEARGVLMIGVSQSGGSPDLVRTLEVGRARGALTLAVTNRADSPLARAAECQLDVLAGPELAVAATKSYTAQLLALYLLVDRLRGGDGSSAAPLPEAGAQVLAQEALVAGLARRYRFVSRLVCTARGYSYPTAREAALKLMETSYIAAQAFSGADLLHGPLAMIDPQVPVLAVVAEGRGGDAMLPVLDRLAGTGADVLGVGRTSALERTDAAVVLPEGVPEELSPLVEILPFQSLARHLALARGADPDRPRGLNKVTETL